MTMPDYHARQFETATLVSLVALLGLLARRRMRGQTLARTVLDSINEWTQAATDFMHDPNIPGDDKAMCRAAALAFLEECVGEPVTIQ